MRADDQDLQLDLQLSHARCSKILSNNDYEIPELTPGAPLEVHVL